MKKTTVPSVHRENGGTRRQWRHGCLRRRLKTSRTIRNLLLGAYTTTTKCSALNEPETSAGKTCVMSKQKQFSIANSNTCHAVLCRTLTAQIEKKTLARLNQTNEKLPQQSSSKEKSNLQLKHMSTTGIHSFEKIAADKNNQKARMVFLSVYTARV